MRQCFATIRVAEIRKVGNSWFRWGREEMGTFALLAGGFKLVQLFWKAI